MAKILIADDDSAALEVLSVALQSFGHEVSMASDGRDAYEQAVSGTPDLVFLDVLMPGMTGLEVCSALRNDPALSPALPIVLLTSLDIDPRQVERSGASGVLPKHHVIAAMRDTLSRYLGENA